MAQDVYEDTLMEHNMSPTRIYNVDVSNTSIVQKTQKVFAQTGGKQVGLLTSAGRGIHVTVVCRMNPYGHYIPSAFIFPRKNWKNELIDSAILGALGIAHELAWMMVRYCCNG
jgi:hypothetical protein